MSGTLAGSQDPPAATSGTRTAEDLAGRGQAAGLHVLARAARPRQWPKNLLVFAAPAAAGSLAQPAPLGRAGLAALLFLLASAGTYLVNDVVDAPADRAHPHKRLRPVASGELAPRRALAAGSALAAAALVGAGLLSGAGLLEVIAAYLATSTAYSLLLKRVPIVELGCVASGFVLRAVAGGVADHLAISGWFLAVACAGALFVVAGKRSAELRQLGPAAVAHRLVLGWYRPGLLATLRLAAGLAAAVAALVGAELLSGAGLLEVIAAYLAISTAYSLLLKRVPIVELGCVASGFVLRAVAGGVADHLAISGWFLAVACAGALFVVAGKRSAELHRLGPAAVAHRPVLGWYRPGLLATLRLAAGLAAAVAYGLWAFSRAGHLDLGDVDLDDLAVKLSLLPFLVGVLLTERAFERGEGGAPEELALRRHDLQVLAGACVLLVAIGVYA